MLISEKYNFLFIHVYKVAGSSITESLKDFADFEPKRYSLPFLRKKDFKAYSDSFKAHATYIEVERTLSKSFLQNYFSFSFIRNPWDWQVSLYFYAKQNVHHHEHELMNSFGSFDEYIEWRINGNYKLQRDFLVNEGGELGVDYVGKLETIQTDFTKICKRLELPQINLPHTNQSNHRNYTSYYSEWSRKRIEDVFEPDIELGKYRFDG